MINIKAITLTNKGYLEFTDNLIASIQKNNINIDLDICTMDSYSTNYFDKKNQNTNLITKSNKKKFLRQDSKNFGEYMIVKMNMIHLYLTQYKYILYLDGDIVLKNEISDYLSKNIGSLDLLIQNDRNPKKPNLEYLCAGFMLIKSSKKTIDFFDTSKIDNKILTEGLHDQGYINNNKESLNYEKLPLELFPNGPFFYENSENIDPKIIHFNYVLGNKKKSLMKNHNEWYI
jgi:hypothetical protein